MIKRNIALCMHLSHPTWKRGAVLTSKTLYLRLVVCPCMAQCKQQSSAIYIIRDVVDCCILYTLWLNVEI